MEQLYALVSPFTNKIIQFSEFKNETFRVAHIEFIDGQRTVTEVDAICVLVDYTPDLREKTYNPLTQTFVD